MAAGGDGVTDDLTPMGYEDDAPYVRLTRERIQLQRERDQARQQLRSLWATVVELGQSLVADDAQPRVVDAARLIEWATECLVDSAADMTHDTQLAHSVARELWATVGATDYAEWLQIHYNYPDGGETYD